MSPSSTSHRSRPALAQMFDRKEGIHKGFLRYSDALLQSGIVWNERTLDQFMSFSPFFYPVSSPISKRVSAMYWCGGITRLVGAGTFLYTRPAKSNFEPWQGQ